MGIYEQLQVKKLINAAGTYTAVGGSRMSRATLEAMAEAAASHVQIAELQKAVGTRIASLTNNEGAYVTTGAAAALYLTTAACISRKLGISWGHIEPEMASRYEVMIFRAHRNPYDWAIRQTGVRLVEVGYPNSLYPISLEDVREKISDNTVVAFYAAGGGWIPPGALSFADALEALRPYDVPLIVDAAAQLPPVENLWRFNEAGATATIFSGGKDLCGPQASGLITGKKWLIRLLQEKGFPTHGIGRMLKVGREEMVGLMVAVEQYVKMDHEARKEWCEQVIGRIRDGLADEPGVKVERSLPNEAGQPIPRALVRVESQMFGQGTRPVAEQIAQGLMDGDPAVFVMPEGENGVYVNPMTLCEDEIPIVIQRLREVCRTLSKR